jgi:hypothetical protein
MKAKFLYTGKTSSYHTESKNTKREGREVAGIAVVGEPAPTRMWFSLPILVP